MFTAAEWALCRQHYASVFLSVCLCLAFVVTRVRDTSPAAVNKGHYYWNGGTEAWKQ